MRTKRPRQPRRTRARRSVNRTSTAPPTDPATPSATTTAGPAPFALLDELDARQDDVLAQLDDLNRRVEDLLKSFLVGRDADAAPSEEPADALAPAPSDA